MKIKYYRKNVYGNELIYLIEDGETAEQVESILRLIGQKTISRSQIARFETLGIAFEETLAPVQK